MYRSQYDTEVTTFSPAGRLHQVEYAQEAVKQGSCTVALRNDKYAVVASLKRSSSDLSSYQQKVFSISPHCGIGVSGLISDARVLSHWMRTECLSHEYVYSSKIQIERLVVSLSDKSQVFTQKSEKRPYGVGLLVVGYDKTGPHVFQTDPTGVYFDCLAQAIGARSQSARTYLEKVYQDMKDSSADQLIHHALMALKGSSPKKLTSRNVAVGIVGEGKAFTIIEGDEVRKYVGEVTQSDDADEVEKPPHSEAAGDDTESDSKRSEEDEEEKAAANAQAEIAREEQMDTSRQ